MALRSRTDALYAGVQSVIDEEMRRHHDHLAAVSSDLPVLADELHRLLSSGKRLRPAFCYWGWRAAGGEEAYDDAVVRAGTALEFLHAAALLHDDVMDRSDSRRGQQTTHRAFAATHAQSGWAGSADLFGESAAIILGDLCLGWADELLARCGAPPEATSRAQRVYQQMRTEVMCGQYLDIHAQAVGRDAPAETILRSAHTVLVYKSAKYSVQAPLLLGAALADAPSPLVEAYTRFGLATGEAFQLRDDVLGVFGDPSVTGKPAGDDLREGKQTMLVGYTLADGTTAQREDMRRLIGKPDLSGGEVDTLRAAITDSGALDRVESRIAALRVEARSAVDQAEVAPAAREALLSLADQAINRSS